MQKIIFTSFLVIMAVIVVAQQKYNGIDAKTIGYDKTYKK